MPDSFQNSASSSSSTPTVVNTPQTDWGLQLSKLLSILGQGQYAWAMDQYNNGKAISDGMIANFMQLSGQGAGLAQNLIQQYNDQYAPLAKQYIAQANSYNSEARKRSAMGGAESDVNQAMTQAADAAKAKLQSYGLNPADGRYQALLDIDRSQRAAAMAGAGQKAALDVEDRGRAMTEKAIQFGQNVPGMAVNAANSAVQASTAAQNANLGQQNAGATLSQTAAPFFNASAAANKTPPVGQKSSSGSTSSGGSNGGRSGDSSNPANNRSSTRDPYGATNPNDMGYGLGNGGPGARTASSAGLPSGANAGGSMAKFLPVPEGDKPDWTNPDFTGIGQGDGEGTGAPMDWTNPDFTGIGQGDNTDNTDWSAYGDQPQFTDPYGDTGGNAQDPYGDNGSGSGDLGYDPSAMPDGGDNSYGDWYGGGDSPGTMDPGSQPQDTSFDFGGGGDEEFAEGGPVPTSASPSHGRHTDDISARLNAGEYVIPRDVVSHRGSGYFRSLIEQSRRSRSGMAGPPPKAKLRPALNRAPSFVSR